MMGKRVLSLFLLEVGPWTDFQIILTANVVFILLFTIDGACRLFAKMFHYDLAAGGLGTQGPLGTA